MLAPLLYCTLLTCDIFDKYPKVVAQYSFGSLCCCACAPGRGSFGNKYSSTFWQYSELKLFQNFLWPCAHAFVIFKTAEIDRKTAKCLGELCEHALILSA